MYDDHDDHEYLGDARVCPAHPWVTTSSPDGMFDCPCGVCEANMEDMGQPELEPIIVNDPVIARRMGQPIYLSQVDDDDDVPF